MGDRSGPAQSTRTEQVMNEHSPTMNTVTNKTATTLYHTRYVDKSPTQYALAVFNRTVTWVPSC